MKFNFNGAERIFSDLDAGLDKIMKTAMYNAAGEVADEMKKAVESLPIQQTKTGKPVWGTPENPITGITETEKKDLSDSLGIAGFKSSKDGGIGTSIGFDGYGSVSTKSFPNGVPNQLLARTIESGTSFRKKHPFVRPTYNKVRKQVQENLERDIRKQIKQITGD